MTAVALPTSKFSIRIQNFEPKFIKAGRLIWDLLVFVCFLSKAAPYSTRLVRSPRHVFEFVPHSSLISMFLSLTGKTCDTKKSRFFEISASDSFILNGKAEKFLLAVVASMRLFRGRYYKTLRVHNSCLSKFYIDQIDLQIQIFTHIEMGRPFKFSNNLRIREVL